ncbi:MAG TPA: hypothetical protein VFJ57_04575 [Solirubrobacterales bacterium]|nr:hypothetical protein [Solirubrobacterales bacterium]
MKLNRTYLLILAAVAAVAALAIPASASAAVWLQEGKALEKTAEFNASGGEVIEVGGGVMLCESSAAFKAEKGSTGTVGYVAAPASCVGLAGNLAECTATAAGSTGGPWTVHVNTTDLTVTGWKVDYAFNAGCAVETVETSFPELKLTPREDPEAFNLLEFSGSGTAKVDGKEAELGYFGSLSLPEEEFGKYGIG